MNLYLFLATSDCGGSLLLLCFFSSSFISLGVPIVM